MDEDSARADTRTRIVEATAELYGRQGYNGTGVKQIVARASAPFGSLYHFFPGGKDELTNEVIRVSGALYLDLIDQFFAGRRDPAAATRAFFDAAADALVDSDYADPCPVATVSMEVASTSEPLRRAAADVFAGWIERTAGHLDASGVALDESRRLAAFLLATLQGAFMLGRALRDPEQVRAAGELAARAFAPASETGARCSDPPPKMGS